MLSFGGGCRPGGGGGGGDSSFFFYSDTPLLCNLQGPKTNTWQHAVFCWTFGFYFLRIFKRFCQNIFALQFVCFFQFMRNTHVKVSSVKCLQSTKCEINRIYPVSHRSISSSVKLRTRVLTLVLFPHDFQNKVTCICCDCETTSTRSGLYRIVVILEGNRRRTVENIETLVSNDESRF